MKTIYEIYRERCHLNGDLTEHLPMLYYLSLKCTGVAEFGIAKGISTSALLAGQDSNDHQGLRWYDGYDPDPQSAVEVGRLKLACRNEWSVTCTTSKSIEIPDFACDVDLLFIDSVHTEETVRKELELHLAKVHQYVALHDTVTFGEVGEIPGTRGLIYGMGLLRGRDWQMVYDSPRNNGFTVFERVGRYE
jgi:hypothetical protein